ncbi:hypothetical protein I6U48_13975 [Clostridium sp. PL3]|uniref:Uncharacterized protein n=1 Tax=Clostridium thailandense TaxID=2794346 RepID=A0A949WRG8_9CLOT|nr:hypothetical protein [Clostridium thailandense]MBV7274010.1 hypothetical protein [Clostridium thailandense]
MISLDFAILKYFTEVEEACAQDITNALKQEYESFKDLKKRSVIMTLMTAEAFGAVKRTRFQFNENGKIEVYYCANEAENSDLVYKNN